MKKKILGFIAFAFAVMMLASVPIAASKPYQTYTYSISGQPLYSPDAYTPLMTVDYKYMGLSKDIDDPRDIFVDENLNVYIADGKNSRIVCLDRYYKLRFYITTFTNEYGVPDELTGPSGVFVTKTNIYVADTDANRIVMFDLEGKYVKIIPQPESELFDENAVYKPVALAVDQYNRLYVVSSTTYQGVIVMTEDGTFTGFIGAQKVALSAFQIIWRRFQTKEQREQTEAAVSTEFNNITIDSDGFIYVTTSSISDSKVSSAIKSKSKSGDYAPVKKLNAAGDEIMRRNGFYPPSGEIEYSTASTSTIKGPSKIIDVAMGPEKTWSIIDEKRNKVFTYDFDGNLLFAFGDKGTQLGNLQSIEGIAYQGSTMLVLDKTSKNFTVYKRTEYGDIIISALEHQNNRQYELSVDDWQEILKRNSNFDSAYIGIGQSLYRSAKYSEAIKYYESAYDTTNYSDAYKELRKEWISKYLLVLVLIVAVVIFLIVRFNKFAAKINKRTAVKVGKRTFGEELLYGFHLIFHPFDGFWDLKHEKRGSVRAAIVYVAVTILAFFYQSIGQGYIMNPRGNYSSIFSQATSILVPLFLWVVANWCLTTLFDGEGSFKDIFIACSYSLLPLPIMVIPTTLISNFITNSEKDILNVFVTIGFIWVGILIFFGMMVTHDYTLGKNVIISAATVVGMAFIMFVGILFTTLLSKMIGFIGNIIVELNYRM